MARTHSAPWDYQFSSATPMSRRELAEEFLEKHVFTRWLNVCTCEPKQERPCPHCREQNEIAYWTAIARRIRFDMEMRTSLDNPCTCMAREGEPLCLTCQQTTTNQTEPY